MVDFVFQSLTLYQILEAGFPDILGYTYAILVALNSLSCVFVILAHPRLSAFGEVLIDTAYVSRSTVGNARNCSQTQSSYRIVGSLRFDTVMAVGAPVMLLLFSYFNFDFDREELRINLEMVPVGAYERQARLMADPVQVTIFLLSFNDLRISNILGFVLRIGMNTSFCYRLKRVIEEKIQQHARRLLSSQSTLTQTATQNPVPKWMAIPFTLFSCSVIVYVHLCTTSARTACAKYPECVAYVHRITSADSCPCLALVDVDKAPKTYEEWIRPPNAAPVVKTLAASGDLRVLQIINRELLELPDELQCCRMLTHM